MAAKLVLGCGYLGRRVAEVWKEAGHDIYAATRSAERAAAFKAAGLNPVVADLTRQTPDFSPVHTALFAVSWDRSSGATPRQVYVEGLGRAIDALKRSSPALETFLLVSTTGVYGDGDGGEIDEDSPCHPTRESGQAYVEAERLLAESWLGDRSIILRLAGIYGPGRIPLLGELQRREPLAVREDASLNLIHVDDAVAAILACEAKAPRPSLYCVSDGHPVRRGEWYRAVASAFGLPQPVFREPAPDQPIVPSGRRGGDKRVRNDKLMREIAPPFRYPSYREGLAAEASRCS
ncbi:MAG TPA: SDR family oxidoreductase [Pirellulaceae bacterium]|jgi:nucleoside-diphosphate-sugar epimerase|nr:SDR family oxidoreductase [Pirellulaceae bacterium]